MPWLEPLPDSALEGLADSAPGPEARYEASEAISLAFVTALQLLPPRQRAVLILRDVLGYPAREAAELLDVTEESVTSALKRARAATRERMAGTTGQPPAPAPGSAEEQDLVDRFTRAFESGDVDGIVALMTEDAWLRMPPLPLEYQGRDLAYRFFTAIWGGRSYRLVPEPGQRAARVRPLRARPAGRVVPGGRPADRHPGRPADQRADPVRDQRAAPVRAAPDAARLSRPADRPSWPASSAARTRCGPTG